MWSLETMTVTTSSIKNCNDLDNLMNQIDDIYDESKQFVIQEIVSNSLKHSGDAKVILNGVTIEVIQKGGDISKLKEVVQEVETCVSQREVKRNFGLNMIRMLGWKIEELYKQDDNTYIVFHKINPAI